MAADGQVVGLPLGVRHAILRRRRARAQLAVADDDTSVVEQRDLVLVAAQRVLRTVAGDDSDRRLRLVFLGGSRNM